MDLLLFFGCGFDYSNAVQITSVEQVQKDPEGFRTVKIMGKHFELIFLFLLDPITPSLNIFYMRPEQAYHFDNMILFACCEILQPQNAFNFYKCLA